MLAPCTESTSFVSLDNYAMQCDSNSRIDVARCFGLSFNYKGYLGVNIRLPFFKLCLRAD